jgi:cytochrome c
MSEMRLTCASLCHRESKGMTMQQLIARGSRLVALLVGVAVPACNTTDADFAPGRAGPFSDPVPVAGAPVLTLPPPGSGGPTSCGIAGKSLPPSLSPGLRPTGPIASHKGTTAIRAEIPPPAISGGTLLATKDGTLLVASDPDRDQVYFVDIASHALLHTRQLAPGDEPGRLVEDAAGRVHVVLRGGHAIASMTRDEQSPIARREVCDLPRGLAYDGVRDVLHVACAEGKLISMGAAFNGPIARSVDIGRDARDVIARGDELFVTHFRSSELLTLDASGDTMQRQMPPTFSQSEQHFEAPVSMSDSSCSPSTVTNVMVESTPTIAWRAIDVPGRGVAMLHQRARSGVVQVTQGGYGGAGCGSGIVQTSITMGVEHGSLASADMAQLALAVDLATDPDGVLLAVVAPGNWGVAPQVQLFPLTGTSVLNQPLTQGVPSAKVVLPGPSSMNPCLGADRMLEEAQGQATAVAFASPYVLAVQQREPAAISFIDVRTGAIAANLDLHQPSRFDTGHEMFHMRAGAGVACASCHAEGGDDSHVWTFEGIGARRTQNLRGGILGTEPFHWNGDMQDFPTLVREVFVGRMAGFQPQLEQTDALAHWIDKQPELKTGALDASAAQRGKKLFESEAVNCAGCHNGEHFSNNMMADVGTGAALQVPSLRGVSFRTPLMHDGCAKTLADRFGSCGGGDRHGHTSQLNAGEISDLTAYLETL